MQRKRPETVLTLKYRGRRCVGDPSTPLPFPPPLSFLSFPTLYPRELIPQRARPGSPPTGYSLASAMGGEHDHCVSLRSLPVVLEVTFLRGSVSFWKPVFTSSSHWVLPGILSACSYGLEEVMAFPAHQCFWNMFSPNERLRLSNIWWH